MARQPGEKGEQSRPARRLALTLPLSLAAHVMLLALLAVWWSAESPSRREVAETRLILLESAPETPPNVEATQRPVAVSRPAPALAPRHEPPAAPELPVPEAAAEPELLPAAEPPGAGADAAPDEPAIVLAIPRHAPRRLDLEPRLPGLLDPETTPAAPGEMPAGGRAWAEARLDQYLRQLLGEDRVTAGAVDPGWSHLARRAERLWAPEFAHVQEPEVTEISGAWLAKLARDWWSNWREDAARYGARGRGIADEDDLRHDFGGLASLELNKAAYGGEGYGDLITAVIEVRIEASGEASASLYSSSGYNTFDEEVLRAVDLALQAPDRSEFPDGPARALYAMSAHYIILPPLPVAGFSFDIGLGHFDPMYPLKKMVRCNARLISVEHPGEADAG